MSYIETVVKLTRIDSFLVDELYCTPLYLRLDEKLVLRRENAAGDIEKICLGFYSRANRLKEDSILLNPLVQASIIKNPF